MAKLFIFCLLLVLIFVSDEKMVAMAEAKECHKAWNCNGYGVCKEKCRNKYNGVGMCDGYTEPSVPEQCLCIYQC
ncbi:hypothetical protein REPUB_Repub16aG0126200 [Reevesia pubescens]